MFRGDVFEYSLLVGRNPNIPFFIFRDVVNDTLDAYIGGYGLVKMLESGGLKWLDINSLIGSYPQFFICGMKG